MSTSDFRLAAKIVVVGIKAAGGLPLRAFNLGLFQFRRDGSDDLGRHHILQFENILQLAFNAVRPKCSTGFRVDQLAADPQAIAGLAHAAFQHITNPKFAAHLLHIDGPALVGEA